MFCPLSISVFVLLTAKAGVGLEPRAVDEVAATAPGGALAEPDGFNRSGKAGYRVFRNPVTGEIVSEPAAARHTLALGAERPERRSAWELRHFYMPGGGEGVELDGWADHALEVKRQTDGELRVVCSKGDEHSSSERQPEAAKP